MKHLISPSASTRGAHALYIKHEVRQKANIFPLDAVGAFLQATSQNEKQSTVCATLSKHIVNISQNSRNTVENQNLLIEAIYEMAPYQENFGTRI
jgi:hypothetical protein